MKKILSALLGVFVLLNVAGKPKVVAANIITADIDGVTTMFAVSPKASKEAAGGALHSIAITAYKNYTQPVVSLTIIINSNWPIEKKTYEYNRGNKTNSATILYSGNNDPASFEPDETQFSPVTVTITSIDNFSVQGTFSGWLSSSYGKVHITNGQFNINF